MAEIPTLTEMVAALEKEIVLAKAISGGPARHEPAYRYLGDPLGKSVIQAYLQQQPIQPAEGQKPPIFYVEVPSLFPEHPELIDVLSRGMDLPMTRKWKDQFLAEERLAEHLRIRQVELVILADAHHLTGRPYAVEWLVSYFRQHLHHAPLVLVGESEQMDALLLWNATAWVVRRFHRFRLFDERELQD